MQLPWKHHHNRRTELTADEVAREKAAAAAAEEARRQRIHAEHQAVLSRSSTAALRREVTKNGFTELLQQAMGRG